MANEKIGVEFFATTAAAVAEIDKLSEATRAAADAADNAGKGQKTLGREVKEARAAQIEATEATRKANDAQRIHTLTVQKLGANSKEAKAAALALNAAQLESKRAGLAAAQALEKTAKSVAAAAQAEDGNLSPATKRAAAQLERMGKEAERAARDLRILDLQTTQTAGGATKLGKSLSAMSVAGGALIAGGVAAGVAGIGVALKGSVTSAIDFESKMTGIGKVLDDQSPENLARVDAQIKQMAVSLGVLPTELAAMTQALAASGLQSDLAGYTEDAAKLGVAFDLSGQEAGHAIASLTASLGLSRSEMQSLMGTVNELDDGMNSSSKQLVEYLESVAGIGRSASISGETMLALGSAIISTGTAPDKAATGVKNFIATMESGTAATDAQVAAFAKLGFSTAEVAKEMASGNAEAQIKKISEALAGLPAEERFATMIDLFGRESIGSVGGLATNVDLLGNAFKIAGDKAAAAGSVQAEFDRVSKTTASNIAQLKANVSVTAIEIGAALLPQVNSIAKEVSAWVSQNRELLKANVASGIAKITEGAKDLWPVLKTVASTVSSVTDAVGAGNLAYIAMAGKVVSLTSDVGGLAVKTATSLIPSLAGMGGKLAAMAGPAGLLAAVGVGAAAMSFTVLKALAPIILRLDETTKKANDAERAMHGIRLEAMKVAAAKLGASNDALAKENERRTKILEAGFTNEGMAEAAAAAGMEARRKALHGRRLSQLDAEEKDLVKASIQRAMIAEKLAYMERADRAGSGTVAPTALDTGPTDKEKRAGARAAKKEAKFAEDSRDFNVEMELYAANENKRIREESIASQQAAFDAEAALFDRKAEGYDRELELIEARGGAEEEQQKAREALLDRRLKAEEEFARAQLAMAKTDAQREQATTRMEQVEHQKRLTALRRTTAAEEAEQARRVALTEKVTARVSDLGTAMVDAAWDAAEGQRGAGLQALGDYLKTVSKQMAIKALVETALGVSALAGVVTAGLAPGHFAAAGIAAGVAVAAGGAGIGLSAAGDARAASARPAAANDAGPGSGVGSTSAADGINPERQKRELDAQEVPISYAQSGARPAATMGGDVININLAGATFIGSKGPEDAAQKIDKMLRQGKAAGKR